MKSFSAQALAERVDGDLVGDPDVQLSGVNDLASAEPGDVTFIRDASQVGRWADSRAGAALVGPTVEGEPGPGRAFIHVPDADLAIAIVLESFATAPAKPAVGVHATAFVHPDATVAATAMIGPGCVVSAHATLGEDVVLYANVTVMENVAIGDGSQLFPGSVVRERCVLGKRVILQSNASIGTEGFNFRPAPDGKSLVHIPHIGAVRIDDDVEIGANAAVDRGKFGDTVIGQGTKIDNLCQIGHNCQIGRMVVIAGLTGLSGGVQVGDGVMIGGNVGAADQITIGAGARIMAKAGLSKSVPPGETWGGAPAMPRKEWIRRISAVEQVIRFMPRIRKLMK